MKNLLPFGLALIASSALAAPSSVESQQISGVYATSISDNGNWIVGQLDEPNTIWIKNLQSGKQWVYTDKNYANAIGKGISDTGTVVGEIDDLPAVWENGEWKMLPVKGNNGTAVVGGITSDGSMIMGALGKVGLTTEDEQMSGPCVWYRQPDGSFGDPEFLDGPVTDFFGLTPQYFQALTASDDGNVVAAIMTSWSGFYQIPYVFTKKATGGWDYKVLGMDLINPRNLPVPTYPGDEGVEMPNYEEYLNAWDYPEQFKAMEAAYPDWVESQEKEGYDDFQIQVNALYFYAQYMTPENKEAWLKLVNIYVEAHNKWLEDYQAYENFLYQLAADGGVSFVMNNAVLSPDGSKLYVTRTRTVVKDPSRPEEGFEEQHTPVIINVADAVSTVLSPNWDINMIISSVSGDGSIFGKSYSPPSDPYIYSDAYVYPEGKDAPVSVPEFLRSAVSSSVYDWFEEKLYQNVIINSQYGQDDRWCVGFPLTDLNMSVISFTGSTIYWVSPPNDNDIWLVTVLNTGLDISGVDEIAPEDAEAVMAMLPSGLLEVKGDVASLKIYSLSGSLVYSVANPSGVITTGLPSGLYVVSAVTASGRTVTRKALLGR